MIHQHWSSLGDTRRGHIWPEIHRMMCNENPTQGRYGDFLNIVNTAENLLQGLPCVSWTEINARVCCDNLVRISAGTRVRRENVYVLGRPNQESSMEEGVNNRIRKPFEFDRPCSNDDQCTTQTGYKLRLVLNRLPPILVMTAQLITRQSNAT